MTDKFTIPAGITLGSKVLKLPKTSREFDRPLWIQSCVHNPIDIHEPYTWINRGDDLIKFIIATPRTKIPILKSLTLVQNEVFLKSPVSGLLLHNMHSHGESDDWGVNTSLLLPEDEPPAENGDFIFSQLTNLLWGNRDYIFYQPKKFQSLNLNDGKLEPIFNEQKNRKCKYVDALPEYQDYLNEARSKHYSLRPYIKHLL